jgi:subtilase family serine protease
MQITSNLLLIAAALSMLAPWQAAHAQRPERITSWIDNRATTLLRGSRSPRIESLTSEGPVEDSMRVSGMSIRFRPTDEQQAELERLLEDQQDPSSPRYHQWLTPEEYGDRFGLAATDLARVNDWIAAQGFHVDHAAKSRTHISFSGTAAQVRGAFHTELHRFNADGKRHFANVREVEIPAQLEPLILTIRGLDDFQDQHPRPSPRAFTGGGAHAVMPGDLAVIYNLAPIFKQGFNGAGQTILITGQSLINLDDVRAFRASAGLPPNEPKLLYLGWDVGYTDSVSEGTLDVEYAGGGAPGANIIYLYGTSANSAAEYGIDQNLAAVVSHSFGKCEKLDQSWLWFRNLAQQAAAQGITWVASSGDEGVAACDWRSAKGANGVSVNLPASVPEVTAVGGTVFVEGNGNYWSNAPRADGSSALSYIPEAAWNETVQAGSMNTTGGGYSSAYPRPPWQIGPGVGNYNSRQVPDVAFTASAMHDPYLIYQTGGVVQTGGTSAGTPFFAGVLAVLNQYVVANGIQARPGLGNINPRLYQLAQSTRGVFHDITTGSNIVPCIVGTVDCTTGAYGYNAGPGYDPVTGLGSIDLASLFENWSPNKTPSKTSSAVILSVDPSPVVQQPRDANGFSFFFTVILTETGGAPTTVTSFSIDGNDWSSLIADLFGGANLPANGTLSVKLQARDLDVPSEHLFAAGGVDGNGRKWSAQVRAPFQDGRGKQTGGAMSLSSDPAVVVKIGRGDPNCSVDFPYGQQLTLKELSGASVKLTKFLAGGFDYTSQIAAWFGSQTLPASGNLRAHMCWQLNTVPTTLDYEVDGIDAAGNTVQATLKVDFKSLDQKSGAPNPGDVSRISRSPQWGRK